MNETIITIGAIIVILILILIRIYLEKCKIIYIIDHPEMIQEMKKVPFWLKIIVWSQYGIHIGNHTTEEELKIREKYVKIHLFLNATKYGYPKHIEDPKILKEMQEYTESLIHTYRLIWMKILSSKTR